MAIPSSPQPVGQTQQVATDPAGLGRSTLRQRFDDLPSNVRDHILEKHRDINTNHDWWDSTYDHFKSQMEDVGIDVDQMYFSGFWSQGDGACFEGRVVDWTKFLTSLGYTQSQLINLAHDHWTFSCKHGGHYYHQYCTSFTVDLPLPESVEDEDFADNFLTSERDGIQRAVELAVLCQLDHDRLEEEFTEAFRNHMRELYKQLEQEHDHLTSDDAVLEALEACDLLEDILNDAMEEAYA